MKCNNGQGQWASAHDTKTHVDGFRHNKGKSNGHNRSQNSNGPKYGAAMATTGNQGKHTTPDSANAYDLDNLPLTSALASRVRFTQDTENAWRFVVSDAIDE
jgi:3-methyladenine DNA glycosylase Mpg